MKSKNKDKTPNCKICEWLNIEPCDGYKVKECGAQGYEITCKVYNKGMCKKLYRTAQAKIIPVVKKN